MSYQTILSSDVLADHLNDPEWVIFDCRFELTNPEWGFNNYQTGHIPGAIYVHLNEDLAAPVTPQTGRHPLPDPAVFAQKCAEWGITLAKQVVIYDLTGGGNAGRMWWMLKAVGFRNVALLDGGLPKWNKENRPRATEIDRPKNKISPLAPIPFNPNLWVKSEELVKLINEPGSLVIDARAPERFNGEVEPIDAVAGHIPGAVNRFYGLNLREDGTFKDPEILRAEFRSILKGIAPENSIISCGSGVTSCHHLLAMEIAGLPSARLYAGSWSEWIRDPNRPRVP
jgi:thiosulfate/3-mercaptopyruvate sulfurtransferase